MRCLIAIVTILASQATGCFIHSEEECTDELRLYDVQVKRDLPTLFSEARKLSFEACSGSGNPQRCETAQPDSGILGGSTLDPTRLLHGTMSQNADGTTHVEVKIQVDDGYAPTPTPVSLSATDASGARVLDAAGQVRWTSSSCHPKPLVDTI